MTAESTAVEFESGHGVYEADLITRPILVETAIVRWSNYDMCGEISFCAVRINIVREAAWNRHGMGRVAILHCEEQTRDGSMGRVAILHCELCAAIYE